MVYNTQDYWASGLCPSSISELSVALSNGPNRVVVTLPAPEDGNKSSFRIVVFSSI
jgi:hypothetical protein